MLRKPQDRPSDCGDALLPLKMHQQVFIDNSILFQRLFTF